jgi:protein O-GlcNAc transferase
MEAAEAYITILRQVPNHWPSYYNLGLVFQSLNRLADARIAYERAVQFNPQLAQGYNNLGIVLQAIGDTSAALGAYERAVALDANLAQARYNLALLQQSKGRISDSIESLKAAVALNPNDDTAWDALYRALLGLKRHNDAFETFKAWEAAVSISPRLTAAGLVQSRVRADRVSESTYLNLAVDWPFASCDPEQLSPILGMLQYFDLTPDKFLRVYTRYRDAMRQRRLQPVPLLTRRTAGDRLRIGYVSADFRRHVMGRLMLDVVSHHDTSKFAVHLISLSEPAYHDEITEKFVSLADKMLNVSALSDFDAARAIAELDLDVLVDLAGHTMAARPGIYAHRPCRKIITHLGYHGCLAIDQVDYKITDRVADDAHSIQYQIEKPLFLDGCVFPFTHVETQAEDRNRYARSRREGEFVFATFVNLLKLFDRCLQAWKKILDAVPHAVLAFSPLKGVEEADIQRVLSTAGIGAGRVRIVPWDPNESVQRARYAAVDVVLDTFPYTGGDTNLAAMDCGVPVITLMGQRAAERIGASLLTHFGVAETICHSEQEYVDLAVAMATDLGRLDALRSRMTKASQASQLTGPRPYSQSLEAAYLSIADEPSLEHRANLTAQEFFAKMNSAVALHRSAKDQRDFEVVEQSYAQLNLEQPEYPPLLRIWASVRQSLGDTGGELALLQQAYEASPDDATGIAELGRSLLESGRLDEAESLVSRFREAGTFDFRAELLYVRILVHAHRFEDARRASEALAARDPSNVDARLLYAGALAECGEAVSAIREFANVISLSPQHSDAHYNLGLLSLERGDLVAAESALRRAFDVSPDHESAALRLADALAMQGKLEPWGTLAKHLSGVFPRSLAVRELNTRAFRFEGNLAAERSGVIALSAEVLGSADEALVETLAPRLLQRVEALRLSEEIVAKLRGAYVESIQRLHMQKMPTDAVSVGDGIRRIGFLLDGLRAPDRAHREMAIAFASEFARDSIEVFLYQVDGVEPITTDNRSVVGRTLAGLGPVRAAQTIAEDAVDVLFDLVGIRHHLIAPLLALKPTRLIVSNPVFADVFDDGLLVDFEAFDEWTALPQWRVRGPTKPMLRLSALTQLQGPTRAMQPRANSDSRFVFAVHVAVEEIPSESIGCWREVLSLVPDSVLAVPANNDSQLRAYTAVLQSGGIGASRIRRYNLSRNPLAPSTVDVVLDAIPTNTGRATQRAIAGGIPVLTVRGPSMSERTSYSVLARAGLTKLVAESAKDYVAAAVRLARDPSYRDHCFSREPSAENVGTRDQDVVALSQAIQAKRGASSPSDLSRDA